VSTWEGLARLAGVRIPRTWGRRARYRAVWAPPDRWPGGDV